MTQEEDRDESMDDSRLLIETPFGAHTASALCVLAASLGLHAAHVDLDECSEEADLFRRIASTLEFPDWFGANWDALFDCLTDLSWLPARGYVVVFENCGELADAAPHSLQRLRELLIESAAAWRERGIPFRAVLGAS
jgi:RNAse (barnase) inhibitor barstar